MIWDEQTISELRACWALGLSYSEIGHRLGCSKNAVVGKAHRLELEERPSPIKRTPDMTPERHARIRTMSKNGCSYPTIARMEGLSEYMVEKVLAAGPPVTRLPPPKVTLPPMKLEVALFQTTAVVPRPSQERGILAMLENGASRREVMVAYGVGENVVRPIASALRARSVPITRAPVPAQSPAPISSQSPCCWPTGQRTSVYNTWSFCGGPSIQGRPYCPEHHARAYKRRGDPEQMAAE